MVEGALYSECWIFQIIVCKSEAELRNIAYGFSYTLIFQISSMQMQEFFPLRIDYPRIIFIDFPSFERFVVFVWSGNLRKHEKVKENRGVQRDKGEIYKNIFFISFTWILSGSLC